jgi:hypothetical protein
MWIVNRKRVVEVSGKPAHCLAHYHFANFGQFLSLVYSGLFAKKGTHLDFFGILIGYWRLIMGKVKS